MILQRKRLRDHFETLADYDGQLIRVARSKVYSVKNGVATYVDKLPFYDPNVGRSRGWDEVIEVSTMPGNTGDQLVDVVSKIPSSVQAALKEKATQLVNQGLTNIDATYPGLGPMTKAKKDAIQVANGMATNGISQMSFFSNPNNMYVVIAVIAGIALMIYFKK